jgi:hypothetical protein
MKIYELLILDAEDVRDFAYHAERLFFSSVEQAESYQRQHFQNPNLFWKVKEYTLDSSDESKTVAGNWTRAGLVQYYGAKT